MGGGGGGYVWCTEKEKKNLQFKLFKSIISTRH